MMSAESQNIQTPETSADDHEDQPKPLTTHLVELRKRLIWVFAVMLIGTIVCFQFVHIIFAFLIAPFAEAMSDPSAQRLIATGPAENFFTQIKLAFFAGIFLTFPVLLWQIWAFIAPGLYKKEKRAFWPFLVATPFLFFLGGAVLYYVVMPLMWAFFLSFQTTAAETVLPIEQETRISEYLDMIMTMLFAFGLCFQLPVLLTLMGKAGLVSADWLAEKRKYTLIIAFAVAAMLTPPDIISQVLLALPILALYELSILLVRLGAKKKS